MRQEDMRVEGKEGRNLGKKRYWYGIANTARERKLKQKKPNAHYSYPFIVQLGKERKRKVIKRSLFSCHHLLL